MRERIHIADLITALVFGLVLAVLMTGSLVGPLVEAPPLSEKRELADLPSWGQVTLRDFPAAWEAWYNDHFGYRALLVRANNLMRLRLWGASTVRQVLPGRRGWLFYDGRSRRGGFPRINYDGILPDQHEKLFTGLQGQLEATRDYFESQGAAYMLVVAPDKWSVHPRYLPVQLGEGAPRTSSDQFLDHLRANSDLDVLDLKPVLRDAADSEQVFHRLDTHWNDQGAWIASQAILERIGQRIPGVVPLDPKDYRSENLSKTDGDLAKMMGLDGWMRENEVRLLPVNPGRVIREDLPRAPEHPSPNRFPISTRQAGQDRPRLLILRDSNGTALIPFLAPSFTETRFIWTSNVKKQGLRNLVEELRPDVVIELRGERVMLYPERYYLPPGRMGIINHPGK